MKNMPIATISEGPVQGGVGLRAATASPVRAVPRGRKSKGDADSLAERQSASASGEIRDCEPGETPAPRELASGSVALADMTVPQLAEAHQTLVVAMTEYDRLGGICAVLAGLVLLEAKRKLDHGQWLSWLQQNVEKSDRDARRRMALAEQFLDRLSSNKTPEGKLAAKSDTRVRFDAQQLLLADLATSLAAIDKARLDMANPVVATVATYVGGRSYRQLLLDLPPALKGGARERSGPPPVPSSPEAVAIDLWKPLMRALLTEMQRGSWAHLPDRGDVSRETLRGIVIDLGASLREAEKATAAKKGPRT